MKNFLLGLSLILSFACNADTVAFLKNKAGGLIMLTDSKCSDKKGLFAYGNDSNGTTFIGCWFVNDLFVFIRWETGDLKTYPIMDWTMMNNKPEKNL
jgi:hypothetical protein